MAKSRFLIIFIFIAYISVNVAAQELKCNVKIESGQIQGTNKSIFETLQKAIAEFINDRNWTNNVFSNEERIECNLLFKISTYSAPDFTGTLQIQARRPIFNSSYSSTVLNYLDQNIQFSYVEFQSLDFNEASYNNLTSLLAYYAYIIVGMDYDTYSYKGGNDYFSKAEVVVNNAQNAGEVGWKPNDGSSNKNRYWLIQNILEDSYGPVRDFLYKYHRLGLDIMSDKTSEGREEIADDLKLLQQVYRDKPDPKKSTILSGFLLLLPTATIKASS